MFLLFSLLKRTITDIMTPISLQSHASFPDVCKILAHSLYGAQKILQAEIFLSSQQAHKLIISVQFTGHFVLSKLSNENKDSASIRILRFT